MPIDDLTPLFDDVTKAGTDLRSNYSFSSGGEGNPGYGWSPTSEASTGGSFVPDQNGALTGFGDYRFSGGTGSTDNPMFDYTQQSAKLGWDVVDPVQTMRVAQANFGGDPMAALRYRYGDDATFQQDDRFNENPGRSGYFAKPTDASRLGAGGVDESKYPLWNLPDTQPGLWQGALGGDWPLTTMAGLAASGGTAFPGFAAGKITGDSTIGALTNFATGGFGGGDMSGDGLGFDPADLPPETPMTFDTSNFNIGDAGMSTMGGYKFDPQTGQFTQTGGPMSTTANLQSAGASGGGVFTGDAAPFIPTAGDMNPGATPGATGFQTGQPGAVPPAPAQPAPGTPQMSPAPGQTSPFMPQSGAPATPSGTPVGGSSPGAPAAPDKPGIADRAINAVMKNPLGAAGLGLNAWRAYQAKQQGQSAQDQLNKNAQPAADASKQLIAQGTAGQVPPAILQQFNTSAQQAKDAIRARYANMGRDPNNDSSAAAELAKVDQDRDAQIANYASTLLNQGLAAAGVANGPQTAAVQAGVNQDKQLSDSMSSALQNYMMLQSLQNRQGGGATPAE